MTIPRATLGVAVVGLGVGEHHARALAAHPNCQLRWLYDLDRARACSLAQQLGVGEVASSYEAILESPDVHLVSIASYDDCHYAQVLSALKAGKHVFAEKPLCQSREQLEEIKRAWTAQRGKAKLGCNLVLRAAPLYRWLKEQLDDGRFGKVYAFDGDYLYGRLEKITNGWRSQTSEYSVMQGGGIHLIDLMLWFTGQRPGNVFASGNRIAAEGTEFRYDDFVAATMHLPSGTVARITANFGCVHRHQHVLRLFGTQATFILDDAGARLHQTRDPALAGQPVTLPALPATKGDLIPAFVSAILEDRDLTSDTQTIFDGISISAACERSLRTRRPERVKYV